MIEAHNRLKSARNPDYFTCPQSADLLSAAKNKKFKTLAQVNELIAQMNE